MSNYVEKIKVGTGAAWPVRDAEAHELLNELAVTIDTTDAAVKSLSGFGLGGIEPQSNVALDNYTAPGWYAFTPNLAIGPHTFEGFGMRVDAYNSNSVIQTVHPNGEPMSELKRHRINGVWGEWEWVNPPMTIDCEYRTTERFINRPVYKKVIELDTIGDVNHWELSEYGITNVSSFIDVQLIDGSGGNITHNPAIALWISNTSLDTESDRSFAGVIAYLTYTKVDSE